MRMHRSASKLMDTTLNVSDTDRNEYCHDQCSANHMQRKESLKEHVVKDGFFDGSNKQKGKNLAMERVKIIDCSAYCGPLVMKYPMLRRLWLVKDICGLVCAIFTWLLLAYGEFVVMAVILLPQLFSIYGLLNTVVYHLLAILAFTSHLRAMLTDPGAVPKGNATKENVSRLCLKDGEVVYKCTKCSSIKPDRAHHCSVCQRCIRKMDHHCPWINNCVGENNQKYFVLFTLYIFLMSIHALFLSVLHLVYCLDGETDGCSGFSIPTTTVFILLLVIESLLFGIFTLIMFCTQMSAVCSDETNAEALVNAACYLHIQATVTQLIADGLSVLWE